MIAVLRTNSETHPRSGSDLKKAKKSWSGASLTATPAFFAVEGNLETASPICACIFDPETFYPATLDGSGVSEPTALLGHQPGGKYFWDENAKKGERRGTMQVGNLYLMERCRESTLFEAIRSLIVLFFVSFAQFCKTIGPRDRRPLGAPEKPTENGIS